MNAQLKKQASAGVHQNKSQEPKNLYSNIKLAHNNECHKSESHKSSQKKKSFKLLKNFKVKDMASKINNKISKIMRRDKVTFPYDTLQNEQSAEFYHPPQSGEEEVTKSSSTTLTELEITHHVFPEISREKEALWKDPFGNAASRQNGYNLSNEEEPTCDPIKEVRHEDEPMTMVDNLVLELTAKLKVVETKQSEEQFKNKSNSDNASQIKQNPLNTEHHSDSKPIPPPRRKKRQQPIKPVISSESSTTSSARNSEGEESESGISSLPEVSSSKHSDNLGPSTTDDSQPESHETLKEDPQTFVDFLKPVKPIRKKKTRRNLNWIKEQSMVERNIVYTTDSETDNSKPLFTPKKSNINPPIPSTPAKESVLTEVCLEELNESLMKSANSPNKIKSAYTLTILTPFPLLDSGNNKRREELLSNDISCVETYPSRDCEEKAQELHPHSPDVNTDQGFATETTDVDSPCKSTQNPHQGQQKNQTKYETENPATSSTPLKCLRPKNLSSAFKDCGNLQQQVFSPIALPMKNRRQSFYGNESRRNSIAMQVIQEDHSLETQDIQPQSNTSYAHIADHNTQYKTPTSSFWIQSGDFSIALDIDKVDPERVSLLYEILSQSSFDCQEVQFGIDGHKFSVHHDNNDHSMTQRLPHNKDSSQYWFCTGDLTIPFSGKCLTAEKIQRMFQFIKASVEETGVLRFGVDAVEFSNVSEFWTQTPKFSMESNYSMLVGLQSGKSNGLEGRGKNSWPHSPSVTMNQSDFEGIESPRSSMSPSNACNVFDDTTLDMEDLTMPRISDAMGSFCQEYESESLDNLFEVTSVRQLSNEPKWTEQRPQQPQRLNFGRKRISFSGIIPSDNFNV